jgi:hypothetical protein
VKNEPVASNTTDSNILVQMDHLQRRVNDIELKIRTSPVPTKLTDRLDSLVHNNIIKAIQNMKRQVLWGAWKRYMLEVK